MFDLTSINVEMNEERKKIESLFSNDSTRTKKNERR